MGLIGQVVGRHWGSVAAGAVETAETGGFNGTVDALNRLPRPLMALEVIGLFAYVMLDPGGFADRMAALQAIPEALWWLMGGVVTFYFGGRETHYLRNGAAEKSPGADTLT